VVRQLLDERESVKCKKAQWEMLKGTRERKGSIVIKALGDVDVTLTLSKTFAQI
jgi:hypothetical protein